MPTLKAPPSVCAKATATRSRVALSIAPRFVYDNALLALAYLERGKSGDVGRARIIGDALLYAQKNDPAADGRFRQAYFAGVPDSNGVYVTTGLSFFQGSAVGDVAWPAIALAQLYKRTRSTKYLDGALWAANFIETTTRDNVNVPPGGYYYGNGQTNKSTEHNIDVYALYTMLAQLSGNNFWLNGAQHALQFVQAMFDALPATSGRAHPMPPTSSTTTVLRTFRPGRTWPCRTRTTRSPSTG